MVELCGNLEGAAELNAASLAEKDDRIKQLQEARAQQEATGEEHALREKELEEAQAKAQLTIKELRNQCWLLEEAKAKLAQENAVLVANGKEEEMFGAQQKQLVLRLEKDLGDAREDAVRFDAQQKQLVLRLEKDLGDARAAAEKEVCWAKEMERALVRAELKADELQKELVEIKRVEREREREDVESTANQ